jgi:hypothetical protein
VAGALEHDRPVVRERLLPAAPLGLAEGDVSGRPHDQGGPVAQVRQASFDLGEEGPARQDLAREDGRRPA